MLRRRQELNWGIDLDELAGLITPKTKLIYLCQPNNPTGAVFSEAQLTAICDLAARNGIYVISDEIYRGLEWSGQLSPAVVNLYERGVSTSSVSKTLGMSGTRLGWMASQDQRSDRAVPQPQVLHDAPSAEPARRNGRHGRAGAE